MLCPIHHGGATEFYLFFIYYEGKFLAGSHTNGLPACFFLMVVGKTGVPGEYPKHGENMQTPIKKGPCNGK